MVLPTIFSAHAPAAEHRARQQAAGVPAPAVTLSPLDAFLLTRLAAFLPHPLTVVDLTTAATDGDALVVLRAAEVPVVSPHTDQVNAEPSVHALSSARETRNGTHRSESVAATVPLMLQDSSATSAYDEWEAVIRALPAGETALILLTETAATASLTGEHLTWLAERVPAAPVLLLPLGMTGTGEVLAQAVRACPPDGARRLIALREFTPFFATSELGLVFSPNDAMMTVVLERLVAMMTGNFQFLPLVRDAIQSATHITALEAELARVQAARAQTEAACAQTEATRALTETAYMHSELARTQSEQALAEKARYAEWLEGRLRHLEEEYIPWKNTVLTGLEIEVRNLHASKAFLLERLLRRVVGRK